MAGLALVLPDRFDLVEVFMAREDIGIAAFSAIGSLWIILCFLVYLTVDYGVERGLPRVRPMRIGFDPSRAATLNFRANLILLGVTGLWIFLTANHVGGVTNLAILAYSDSLAARDLLLENKLFTGMRLFYAALPATGALAAALIALPNAIGLSRNSKRLCQITVAVNLLSLLILPIVMSQRLLLLQLILSAYIGVCMVRGRLVGVRYIPLGMGLFMTMWVLREAITNPSLDRSAWDVGTQKLAYYFVNDLWNTYKPLTTDIKHTFGMFSLRGVLFFTFTDGYFAALLSDRLVAIENVRGGGDFSIFTAPYVDFGPIIGAGLIAFVALIFRIAYHSGRQSFIYAVIYGQIGASLLFSTHGVYFTHHNFFFSVIVLVLVCHAARNPAPRHAWVNHA
ncbi:MAG: hypothetical protein ABJI45_08170 [Paracoccaceae bacterium]